ncbi:hypothetical protein GE061_008392 [Apolygus lucorum]|uniref:Uncharacterized protein n=1 Tax=Apolygus lucorum TaxID=248454 RepID=A0A8S9WNV6_APOLU|nr:hypothetical protein GE061_008392 [Apolygus lucorum]
MRTHQFNWDLERVNRLLRTIVSHRICCVLWTRNTSFKLPYTKHLVFKMSKNCARNDNSYRKVAVLGSGAGARCAGYGPPGGAVAGMATGAAWDVGESVYRGKPVGLVNGFNEAGKTLARGEVPTKEVSDITVVVVEDACTGMSGGNLYSLGFPASGAVGMGAALSRSEPGKNGCSREVLPEVETKEAGPTCRKPEPTPPALQEFAEGQIQSVLAEGGTAPSKASWNVPIDATKGTVLPENPHQWKFGINFRKRNPVTERDKDPLPERLEVTRCQIRDYWKATRYCTGTSEPAFVNRVPDEAITREEPHRREASAPDAPAGTQQPDLDPWFESDDEAEPELIERTCVTPDLERLEQSCNRPPDEPIAERTLPNADTSTTASSYSLRPRKVIYYKKLHTGKVSTIEVAPKETEV